MTEPYNRFTDSGSLPDFRFTECVVPEERQTGKLKLKVFTGFYPGAASVCRSNGIRDECVDWIQPD
ncbi:hypothetical protein [Chlorobium phaeobacteroides]|uniref:hypothetical protein n=1 Tax=Chlorobium phaeobacteroides TaxID=1096 RepID=UPI0003096583|nr:hypothetical protein [Chlorobium phaeobacteroides]MBV5328163.1 hypothetical protein [Chlorobium sp.]